MSEGINLINTNKQTTRFVPVKRLSVMRSIAVGLLFIVSVSAIIMFILVALSPLPELKRQEQSLRFTLSQSHTIMGKLDFIQERTSAVGIVLASRHSFDEIIQAIQSVAPIDVTINALRMDKDQMTITAQSKSLQSLDIFLNEIIKYVSNNKYFSSVKMTELSSDNTNYEVTLQLVLL